LHGGTLKRKDKTSIPQGVKESCVVPCILVKKKRSLHTSRQKGRFSDGWGERRTRPYCSKVYKEKREKKEMAEAPTWIPLSMRLSRRMGEKMKRTFTSFKVSSTGGRFETVVHLSRVGGIRKSASRSEASKRAMGYSVNSNGVAAN